MDDAFFFSSIFVIKKKSVPADVSQRVMYVCAVSHVIPIFFLYSFFFCPVKALHSAFNKKTKQCNRKQKKSCERERDMMFMKGRKKKTKIEIIKQKERQNK